MSPERTSANGLNDKLTSAFEQLDGIYRSAEERVGIVSPYVRRTIEVVLAVALLAVLGHWLYWVYVLGV